MDHHIYQILLDSGLCQSGSFELFSPRVRDSEDISAFRCKKSGVIVLDSIEQGRPDQYANYRGLEYWAASTPEPNSDDCRRAYMIRDFVTNKRWLDYGAGMGGCLSLLKDVAQCADGLELQPAAREWLIKQGLTCYASLNEVPEKKYDLITLFHVFEHIYQPIETLQEIRKKMRASAQLIVEVPHAKDALLTTYGCESFKRFTLWSEHLILHTKESLKFFLEQANFQVQKIEGVQRYGLSNHLHWLAKGQPGGHQIWQHLESLEMNQLYEQKLIESDNSDTLIAYATV